MINVEIERNIKYFPIKKGDEGFSFYRNYKIRQNLFSEFRAYGLSGTQTRVIETAFIFKEDIKKKKFGDLF